MIRSAALLTLAVMTGTATAATNWTIGGTQVQSSVTGDCRNGLANAFGNSCRIQGTTTRSDGKETVTAVTGDNAMVSAWATTNQAADGKEYWQDAQLMKYSGGFGVTNRDGANNQGSSTPRDPNETTDNEPEHAIDNNDKIDGVLYTFTRNIALQSLVLGYKNTDADLAVFRFAGTGVPPQLSTTTAGGLIGAGWEHVGNYADVGTNTTLNLQNTGNVASSWWLVTAYNPTYGDNQKGSGTLDMGSRGRGNDYFKLLTVSGDIKVSEPAALALAGLGLFGVLATRRRKAQVAV